jgi:hypothetical protein
MSRPARWKEDRIREQIYLEQLKQTETLPNGAGVDGAKSLGAQPVYLLQQTFGSRSQNRRKQNQLSWIMLSVTLLAAWAAICVWVYLSQFGIHR